MDRNEKTWEPIVESDGPWLIRSHHWGRWHVRSDDGGACGYTDAIERAGVFGFDKAKAYHDPPPYCRDEAVPVSRALSDMEARLAIMTAERDAFAAKVQDVRAAISKAEGDSHGR